MTNLIPFLFIGAIILAIVFQAVKHGGFKGAVFRSRIAKTMGEIPVRKKALTSTVVRVHSLENGNIGIELTSKAPFGYSMTGFALTKEQAEQLIGFIHDTN